MMLSCHCVLKISKSEKEKELQVNSLLISQPWFVLMSWHIGIIIFWCLCIQPFWHSHIVIRWYPDILWHPDIFNIVIGWTPNILTYFQINQIHNCCLPFVRIFKIGLHCVKTREARIRKSLLHIEQYANVLDHQPHTFRHKYDFFLLLL